MGVLKAKGAKAVEAKVKAAKAQAGGGRLLRTGRQQVCVLDTASERSVTSQSVVITQPEQPVILRLVKAMASCRQSVQRGRSVAAVTPRAISVSDVSTNMVMARSNLSLNMANDPYRVTWQTPLLPRYRQRCLRLCLVWFSMVPLMHNLTHFLRK